MVPGGTGSGRSSQTVLPIDTLPNVNLGETLHSRLPQDQLQGEPMRNAGNLAVIVIAFAVMTVSAQAQTGLRGSVRAIQQFADQSGWQPVTVQARIGRAEIMEAQRLLNEQGYAAGPVDGAPGSEDQAGNLRLPARSRNACHGRDRCGVACRAAVRGGRRPAAGWFRSDGGFTDDCGSWSCNG